MRIKITAIKPYKENEYDRLLVMYNRDGKDQERKLARVGKNIKAFDVMKLAQPGQEYDVKLEKNGQFWDWVDIVVAGESSASDSTSTTSTGGRSSPRSLSTYETPEERQLRQLHIVRQSSLSNSVNLLGPKAPVEKVLEVAQTFVDFVYNGMEKNAEDPFGTK